MTEERKSEDVLAGVLLVQVGGQPRHLPVRTIASAREWKRELTRAIGGSLGGMNLADVADGGEVAVAAGDRILELVSSYDETAALGGREYLEKTATDAEAYAIFRRLLEVSFPFVHDLRTVITELRALGLADILASAQRAPVRSAPPSSTDESSEPMDSDRLVASSAS